VLYKKNTLIDNDYKELILNNKNLKNNVNKIIYNDSESETLNNEFKINYIVNIFEYFQKNSSKITFLIEKLKNKIDVLKIHNINLNNNLLSIYKSKHN
jgi:hypothetical protein